jgi:hypothetical protein
MKLKKIYIFLPHISHSAKLLKPEFIGQSAIVSGQNFDIIFLFRAYLHLKKPHNSLAIEMSFSTTQNSEKEKCTFITLIYYCESQ